MRGSKVIHAVNYLEDPSDQNGTSLVRGFKKSRPVNYLGNQLTRSCCKLPKTSFVRGFKISHAVNYLGRNYLGTT